MRVLIRCLAVLAPVALLASGCQRPERPSPPPAAEPSELRGTGGSGQLPAEQPPSAEQSREAQSVETMLGAVQRKGEDSMLVRDNWERAVELDVPEGATLTRNGEEIAFDDLKQGSEVRVEYRIDGDHKTFVRGELLLTPSEKVTPGEER